jgi:hypothetical protein
MRGDGEGASLQQRGEAFARGWSDRGEHRARGNLFRAYGAVPAGA